MIVSTSMILRPVIATVTTNVSDDTATIHNKGYNSFTLLPSNQSTGISSSLEKNNVTLVGLFNNLGVQEIGINYSSLYLMNSIDGTRT